MSGRADTGAAAPLGLIAGRGELPAVAARALRAAGHRVIAVGFDEPTRAVVAGEVDEYHALRLGQLQKLISTFSSRGVRSLLMLGKVRKSAAFRDLMPDLRALRLWRALPDRKDDTILRALGEELGREGIAVEEAQRFLGHLFAPAGRVSRRAPDRRERADIEFGLRLARELARLDIGQTVLVKDLVPVAVEALEGTDETIRRAGRVAGAGTVMVKVSRPQQDFRFDVPAVGAETARALVEAGVSALALEAHRTIFLQREETLDLLDRHRVAVWGCESRPT